MTIIEMMVALALLGMLIGMVVMIYMTGASAWRKGDTRSELLQDALVTSSSLASEIEQSTYGGLEAAPSGEGVAVLSLRDGQGNFELSDTGAPIWQRWVVYYFKSGEIRQTEVPWVAPPEDRVTPMPLSAYNPPLSITDYLNGGRVIARNVYDAEFTLVPGTASVSFHIELSKRRYGRPDPEFVTFDSVLTTRN